jgi:hypothetical protein
MKRGIGMQKSGLTVNYMLIDLKPQLLRHHNSPFPPLILRGGAEGGGVTTKKSIIPPFDRVRLEESSTIVEIHNLEYGRTWRSK